jgi:sugar transferase (PEP-CTERM/EpsH1 system associated)
MKILLLTPQLPYPPDKGATIRNFALIKGLAQRGHAVDLLSFIRSEEDQAWLPQLRPYVTRITTVVAPQRSSRTRVRTLLTSTLPDMAWRLPSQEYADALRNLLRTGGYDIVQAESLEVAQYALQAVQDRGDAARPLVFFDDLNAEYVLQKRAFEIDAQRLRTWPKALYSWLQWRRLRRYETRVCTSVDAVLAVSEADAHAIAALSEQISVQVVPNGVDCVFFSVSARPAEYPDALKIKHLAAIVFTGTMNFRPNADAVIWFCQDILPLIKKDAYHVHLYIVGNAPTAAVRALAGPAVTVTGYVSDIRPYIANSAVYVVPMRMGSGTKLKVMEAMAMHIPVVSTTMGAEGIDVTPDHHILLADTPQQFAHHVVSLLRNSDERQRLADNARRLVEEKYDWTTIVPSLEAIYTKSLLSR